MKHQAVQRSLEEFVATNWSETSVAYDNAPFNSDLYSEFLQHTVVFAPTKQIGIENWYRVYGMLILTVHVKPGIGTERLLALADTLTNLLAGVIVYTVPPNDAPEVQMQAPDVFKDLKDSGGWVRAQVSCPFYYTLEI